MIDALLTLAQATLAQSSVVTPRPPLRPFIDPIEMHSAWWILLIPMSFGIAVVYKAVRLHAIDRYWREVMVMTAQIVLGMLALAAASYFLVMIFAQYVAERAG